MAHMAEAVTMEMRLKKDPNTNLAFTNDKTHGKPGSLLHRLHVKRLIVILDGQKVALPSENIASVAMVTAELTHRLHRKMKKLRCVGLMLPDEVELDSFDSIADVVRDGEILTAVLERDDEVSFEVDNGSISSANSKLSYVSSELSKPSNATAPQYMTSASSLTTARQSSADNVVATKQNKLHAHGVKESKPRYNISLSSLSSNNQSTDNVIAESKFQENEKKQAKPQYNISLSSLSSNNQSTDDVLVGNTQTKTPHKSRYDLSMSSLSSATQSNDNVSSAKPFSTKKNSFPPKRPITPVSTDWSNGVKDGDSILPETEDVKMNKPKQESLTPPRKANERLREVSPKRAPAWGDITKKTSSPRAKSMESSQPMAVLKAKQSPKQKEVIVNRLPILTEKSRRNIPCGS